MGIYDRDYERNRDYRDAPGYHLSAPKTVTIKLMLVTAGVYVAQLLSQGWITSEFALNDRWYYAPWQAYQLITYGFLHSPNDLWHILLNMYGLWLFGRSVEDRYGSKEFLVFYLSAIVVAGVVWTLTEIPFAEPSSMVGASGGVVAVMVLFALVYPRVTILFMFILPMPMWVLAVLLTGMDVLGAMDRSGAVACTAHLGGALFALIYYRSKVRLSDWLPTSWKLPKFRRRPPLRVLDPNDEVVQREDSADLEVDEILRKIGAQGQDSLTRRERQILQQASEKYQKRGR